MAERQLLALAPGPCVNLRKVRCETPRNRAEQPDGIGLCQAPPSALLPVELRLSCPEGAPFLEILYDSNPLAASALNRPGYAIGSNFQLGWSPYEQDDEQILP
jgi:hypothetical protein